MRITLLLNCIGDGMQLFHIAREDEIKRGETADIYFLRTEEILKSKGLHKVEVIAEVTSSGLPKNWTWAILCGIEEEANLFKGYPITVNSMPEGTLFRHNDYYGIRVPVMTIEGPYTSFAKLETAILGLICQASGMATAAARIKKEAGEKLVLNFGARRMHPSLSPLIGRAAYIGGTDGVSSIAAARLLGIEASGTMPHSLIIVFGDPIKAWKAFDEVISKDVRRVALVDTYYDEKIEAVEAAEALKGRLWGVRLDTPRSRKGDFAEIIKEVRWELNIRGYESVKIFVSGGLNEESVRTLSVAGADGFGVGTCISNSPIVDFAMDIVEIKRKPVAKRGKLSCKKQVWRCPACLVDTVLPFKDLQPKCPKCNGETQPMLKPLIEDGKIVTKLPKPLEIRRYVIKQLEQLNEMIN